jgi:hypothetical protein
MTISSVLASSLTQLVAEAGPAYFQVGISNASPALKSKRLKKENVDGEEYAVLLYPGSNHASGFTLDDGLLPVGGSGAPVKARQMPAIFVSQVSMGGAASKMKLSTKQRTKQLDAELKTRAADCGRQINRAIIGGTISPETTNNWSSTAANGTLSANFLDVSMFREGQAVDYVATADKSYVVRVQSVTLAAVGAASANIAGTVVFINDVPNPATGSVVALTAVGTATTDIFALRGTYPGFGGSTSAQGAAMSSFDSMAGSASKAISSLMGQDPSSMGIGYNWRANYLNIAGVYSQEAVLAFAARIGTVSDLAPDSALAHPQTCAAHRASGDFHGAFAGVSAALSPGARPMPLDKSIDKYGKPYKGSGLSVAGAEIIEDPNCQPGRLILWNSDTTKLAVWEEMGPDEEAGSAELLDRDRYRRNVQFSGLYNLVTDVRSSIGILDGFTNL